MRTFEEVIVCAMAAPDCDLPNVLQANGKYVQLLGDRGGERPEALSFGVAVGFLDGL
jgi:hypothetical protein